MNLIYIKKHRTRSLWYEGFLRRNPILVCGLALPFAVMITNNLKNSAAVSLMMACVLLPCVLLASLIGARLPVWGTCAISSVLSLAIIIACVPLVQMISPEITDALGMYIPILSVNTILLFLCERHARQHGKPLRALSDAIFYSLGFAVALGLIAVVRELVGNNTLWGIPVSFPIKLSGLQVAFSGFIVAAFLSALFRFVRRRMLLFSYRRDNNPSMQEVVQ